MKIIAIILFFMFPVAATAQNQTLSGVDMGNMMQLMQEMQQCMAKVDQIELEKFEKESEKINEEIETLCNKGERKKAQKTAVAYGKKVMKNSVVLQMKECGEITKGLLPENSPPSFDEDFDFSDRHVCDE